MSCKENGLIAEGLDHLNTPSKMLNQDSLEDDSKMGSNTFINCDLRFFNLQYLVDQLGHFEVVQIDPPWRIKGA